MSKEEDDIVQVLIEDIENGPATLFHDQYDDAFIALNGNGTQVLKISSKEFKQWLTKHCWQVNKVSLSSISISKVVNTLSGMARFDGDKYDLNVRVAWSNGSLLYDCGKNEPAVLMTPDGWQMINKPPIIFRRLAHQNKQVWPVKESNIDLLSGYVNLSNDAERLLFTVYTVAAFIPGFPHPLLILHGQQGAGKSTPMRLLKKLIDPSQISGLPAPRNNEAFVQLAYHHAFLFFDNLSTLPTWFSDSLARASTGDSFSKRMLFTDDDDVFYVVQRPMALNGISQVITKPDLLDRSILLKLERIDQDKRRPEKVFWEEFEEDKPIILGSIFDTLGKAMAIYPNIDLEKSPRMADFAKWGCAIAEAIGSTKEAFLAAYNSNIDRQNDEAIYASSVAQAILMFMDEQDEWEGTPADLLVKLEKIAFAKQLDRDYSWPKGPVWLTRRLNEVQTNLASKGINVSHSTTATSRIIKLTKITDNTVNTDTVDIDDKDSKTVNTLNI